MKQSVDDRAAMLGEYIVRNKATVRRAAKQFGVSKSTVHKDVAERLRHVWLCHISEENNHPELARKTVDACLAAAGVVVGKDVELEVLKRRIPSQIYDLKSAD